MIHKFKYFLFYFVFTISLFGQSQIGTVDPSFNVVDNGYFGNNNLADDQVNSIGIQIDGKLIIGGKFDHYSGYSTGKLARILPDGSLDQTFNIGSGFNGDVSDLHIYPSGKMLVAGNFTMYNGVTANSIVLLNQDGTIDPSFDAGTGTTGTINDFDLDANGLIYIAGSFTTFNGVLINDLVRLNLNGTVDSGFLPEAGFGSFGAMKVKVLLSNMIMVIGSFTDYNGSGINKAVRLFPNGTHDPLFNGQFDPNSMSVHSIHETSSGSFYLGGRFTGLVGNVNMVARFDQNGTLDPTFQCATLNYTSNSNYVESIIEINNEVYLAGYNFNMCRRSMSGSNLGTSTSIGAVTNMLLDGNDLYLAADNSLYKAEFSSLELIKMYGKGGGASGYGGQFGYIAKSKPLLNDKILIKSQYAFNVFDMTERGLLRLFPNGEVDTTFNFISNANFIKDFYELSDGKILISGKFNWGTPTATNIICVMPNGTIDLTFQFAKPPTDDEFNNIVVQPDGKILYTRSISGQTTIHKLERVMPNGDNDPSFNIQSFTNGTIARLLIRSDGKIFLAGKSRLIAFENNGTPDAVFNNWTNPVSLTTYGVQDVLLDQNDNLLVLGDLRYITGGVHGLNRILPNNSFDPSFDPVTIPYGQFRATLLLQNDNKIIICKERLSASTWSLTRHFSNGALDNSLSYSQFNSYTNPDYYYPYGIFLNSHDQIIMYGSFDWFHPFYQKNGITCILNDNNFNPCSYFSVEYNSITDATCSNSGEALVQVNNGLPPYTYNWTPSVSGTNPNPTFDTGGMHTCEITDANGCITNSFLYINGPSNNTNQFDVQANLVSGDFRPGFNAHIWIDAFNSGCPPVSGEIKLVLQSDLTLISSTANQILGDTLIWDYSNWSYDSTNVTTYHILVETSTNAQIGDSINLQLFANPLAGDNDTTNNFRNYYFPVINGYDPNKKSVYPDGKCENRYISNNQKLVYTAQFQNTGNSEAINIFVIDTLDFAIDPYSLKVLSASHSMRTEMISNNIVKFNFDNINLPDSTSNELESHGYVIFEVGLKPSLIHEQQVKNNVDIYFDYNPPVITDEVYNTIFIGNLNSFTCDTLPNFQTNNQSNSSISIFPNPTNSIINISIENFSPNNHLYLCNANGNIISELSVNENDAQIDVSHLASGLYFIRYDTPDKTEIVKVLKLF